MRLIDSYVVVELINTFAKVYKDGEPKTIKEIYDRGGWVTFHIVSSGKEKTSYAVEGETEDGTMVCKNFDTGKLEFWPAETEISDTF